MPENPRISHLLETSLYVANLSRSQQFYQRIFGFDTLLEDHRMCALLVPNSGVLLLFKHDGSLHPSKTPGGVIPHMVVMASSISALRYHWHRWTTGLNIWKNRILRWKAGCGRPSEELVCIFAILTDILLKSRPQDCGRITKPVVRSVVGGYRTINSNYAGPHI